MTKIHQYTALCASRQAQEAAIEALRVPDRDVQAMVDDYDGRRRFFVAGLNRIGLPCHLPEGAFYAFPSISPTGLSADAFAERLLLEARVAVVPGTAFGVGGEEHIRCSYATACRSWRRRLSGWSGSSLRCPASCRTWRPGGLASVRASKKTSVAPGWHRSCTCHTRRDGGSDGSTRCRKSGPAWADGSPPF